VEAIVEVRDPEVRIGLQRMLDLATDRGTSRWELRPDGSWSRHSVNAEGEPLRDYQLSLLRATAARGAETRAEPHP
jgi:polyphosphate kinase